MGVMERVAARSQLFLRSLIIGVLLWIVAYLIVGFVNASTRASTKTTLAQITTCVVNNAPEDETFEQLDLRSYYAVIKKRFPSIAFRSGLPVDRWGEQIRLELKDHSDGFKALTLISSGPDRAVNTPDDIRYSYVVDVR